MPTEHEFKFVISLDVLKNWDKLPPLKSIANIRQGYVAVSEGAATRVRAIIKDGVFKWFLTFKRKVKNRQIEVEVELEPRDGEDLWSVADRIVEKTRHYIEHEGLTWEVDLFHRDDVSVYFVMAEVELPEGTERPKNMPDFLKSHVLYEVALTDERFSNKKLGDVDYAIKLYQQIQEGVIDANENQSV